MEKKTKIVATIGPTSWDNKVLKQMIANGMNVARINASFADHAELERVAKQIRKLSKHVGLLMGTKGHKLRISDFGKDKLLKDGQKFSLFTEKVKKGVIVSFVGACKVNEDEPEIDPLKVIPIALEVL